MFQFIRRFLRNSDIKTDILGFVGLWPWGQPYTSLRFCVYNYYNCIHRNEARKEREAKLSKIIYCKLKAVLPPEDIPKSVGGFSRMRNANSKNYQTLVKKAEAAGFVFPQTPEDVKNWPENQ